MGGQILDKRWKKTIRNNWFLSADNKQILAADIFLG